MRSNIIAALFVVGIVLLGSTPKLIPLLNPSQQMRRGSRSPRARLTLYSVISKTERA